MNKPRTALAASASNEEQTQNAPALIAPAADIFDYDTIRAEIFERCPRSQSETETRKTVVSILLQAQKDGRDCIADAFAQQPFKGRETCQSYSWLTDCIIRLVHEVASDVLHPLATPARSEKLAIFAVGGYGRGEMAPFSDVDLLFLTPYKITPWAEGMIESMLYILWDLKMKVGHASRTVKDCLRLGGEDFTIRTAMLENRYISGEKKLAEELDTRLWKDLFTGTEKAFIEAKLAERSERHRKQGGQRYLVEPNVKEAKGGLRDLQSLFWIAKYIHHTNDTSDLVKLGLFRPEELDTFLNAEEFLWTVRCHLHLVARRASEQLSFDMQVEVASRMGYNDTAGRRAVECFMQDYFRHATAVGDLTRIFLTSLEQQHRKEAPPLLKRVFSRKPKLRDEIFGIENNRIAIFDEAGFLADKLNLLRFFEESMRSGLSLHPDGMRLVKANLHLIDDQMRQSKDASKIFFNALLKHGNPERALRRMNECGVLASYMPEFAPVVAMMQFNMYHHYTVDEHTIQCIKVLAKIEQNELIEELPVASDILERGVNRKVIYLALLLHDIGKGRDVAHEILGAQIARKVAPRLGLKKDEAANVEWLVRYHLVMSDMAQKRDISDPRTVRDFAKVVGTQERLDLLTVLTVCDIRGVGPGVWNNWKATLLRSLFRQTRSALQDGMEALNRENRGAEAKKLLRAKLSDWQTKDLRVETGRHYDPYWQGLHITAHEIFARQLRDIKPGEMAFDIHPDPDRDATRVCFALEDHPGIFSRLTGALALSGANVVDARTFTTKDGYATAAFWIQDSDGSPYDETRIPRLTETIRKILAGEVVARDAMVSKDKLKKREKAFKVPTTISFDNDGSDIFTIIEVDTRDRPGLLHDLSRALAYQNIYVASAVIATYGEQVVDTFYVKDSFGLKLYSQVKQDLIAKKLQDAIERGAERAEEG